jgi:hypothetical protein
VKRLLLNAIVIFCLCVISAETPDKPLSFSFCREIWNTNALQCVQSARGIINRQLYGVSAERMFGQWFVDFLGYPDVTETNRIEEVLYAKERAIFDFARLSGIVDNTNAWFATADFLGRLREVKDPRWIDESARVITGYVNAIPIYANTNSLFDFTAYRKTHPDADFRDWKMMVASRKRRERAILRVERMILRVIGEFYWRCGAKSLSIDEQAMCRSNIVVRARLTRKEEEDVFAGINYKNLPVPSLRGRAQ